MSVAARGGTPWVLSCAAARLLSRGARRCYRRGMTEPADESRIARRADLLPEEEAAGSDDSLKQAEVILEESDERTEHPEKTREESTQTPD